MAKKPDDEVETDRVLIPGKPNHDRCDNKRVTARYTIYSFLPIAVVQQFRRFANLYFLIIGLIMFIGWYFPDVFESAINPWTTLGPLALVISASLAVEAYSDKKRHVNDQETNNAPCVILSRAEELVGDENAERDETVIEGKDVNVNISKAYYAVATTRAGHGNETEDPATYVKVAFQKIRRMDVRQGHFVVVRNRDMVPADIVLLASSNDQGGAYIETSSIDGETNLKLRTSPQLPKSVLRALRDGVKLDSVEEFPEEKKVVSIESISAATKRLTRLSALGRPEGVSVLDHPDYNNGLVDESTPPSHSRKPSRTKNLFQEVSKGLATGVDTFRTGVDTLRTSMAKHQGASTPYDGKYIAALTTEPPNASVDTFSGKLTLPPFGENDTCHDIALGAENILLRGAVLRNTEWAIGIACFTGDDTKLVQNEFQPPSKFSQLDRLMNRVVISILCIMFFTISYLSSAAVVANEEQFDDLFYVGFNRNASAVWPYLPGDFEPPQWKTDQRNWLQYFFLYVTLLNNFVPLSLYMTVELVTIASLWFIYADVEMYDDTTNTRAAAKSTTVTDLGRIQYIFSDKTGTLTQNVMRFKRCSVDGLAFGAPIQKSRPGAEEDDEPISFHPLRHLLVGKFSKPQMPGLEGLGGSSTEAGGPERSNKLTWNAEMFLRVMSLCHTVVVEKDIDKKDQIESSMSVASASSISKRLFRGRKRADTGGSNPGGMSIIGSPLSAVAEDNEMVESTGNLRVRTESVDSFAPGQGPSTTMGTDGAPYGYAYQAESPDEGALVSCSATNFGFQVVGRDSSGIKLRVSSLSHLQDDRIVEDLKSQELTLQRLAAESANELNTVRDSFRVPQHVPLREPREETWAILAVNKFDSTRKRMSVLLRSPPELGGMPFVFCKGADSAMLEDGVCMTTQMLKPDDEMTRLVNIPRPPGLSERGRDVSNLSAVSESEGVDSQGWDVAQMLGIQSHLGDFAKEGLRTLVLGMRVLTEKESMQWLEQYKAAATAMKNRSEKLKEAALAIERGLHIVGATAIEDKLQVGVPATIEHLEQAGIKFWVLTGDKRETAVEIGYSTNVLTPRMHVTEVSDQGADYVRTQIAMEFIRLTKKGKLVDYQRHALDDERRPSSWKRRFQIWSFHFGKALRRFVRSVIRSVACIIALFGMKERSEELKGVAEKGELAEATILEEQARRRKARDRAEKLVKSWLKSNKSAARKAPSNRSDDELSLTSEETPKVFNLASSAKEMLKSMRESGQMTQTDLRQMSLAHLTAQQVENTTVVDEDTLSLDSFFPGRESGDFDRRKRTLLERIFAIDRDVRKGRLIKHMKPERRRSRGEESPPTSHDGPRALVIEGAALKHLLGDQELEEILFSVASNCSAVIACRVSPKQKALLVDLVRTNVRPEPITLAIGDGANDVGMIQEAHVGVGISGKEGKQAVNAADFAIAQFRFLEDLVLIHGRWNFLRLSTVVLFSFYKNAVMAGILVLFAERCVYSGTPLFDEWIIAMLNFVAAFPILLTGIFDRCISREYVKANPIVYKATRLNEVITPRTLARWIVLVFVHIFSLYFFTVPGLSFAGGISPAWDGLMRNEDRDTPGEGEGSDLKSVGTITFTCMILIMAYKVLYETKTLIHGSWPAVTCCKMSFTEGFVSRVPYTWIGIIYLSIGFYFTAIWIYSLLGRRGAGTFSAFVGVTEHVLGKRSLSWMLILFVPISAMSFDVVAKVYSNMFYPTQTQIHLEIEWKQNAAKRRRRQRDPEPAAEESSYGAENSV